MQVVPVIFQQFPRYERAVASNDEVTALGLARVFSHMCEAYVDLILGPQDMEQISLLRLALTVFSHSDYTIARKSLTFWFDLLTSMTDMQAERKEETVMKFGPILIQLVDVCCKRMERGPMDEDDEVPPSNSDDPDNEEPNLSEFQEHRLVCLIFGFA